MGIIRRVLSQGVNDDEPRRGRRVPIMAFTKPHGNKVCSTCVDTNAPAAGEREQGTFDSKFPLPRGGGEML